MTWDCFSDRYSLKFRLNLHKKFCSIPSGEDLDFKFLEDPDVTKKNMLSVACQFYDPAGLASPSCSLSEPYSVRYAEIPNFHDLRLCSRPCYQVQNCSGRNLENKIFNLSSPNIFSKLWPTLHIFLWKPSGIRSLHLCSILEPCQYRY